MSVEIEMDSEFQLCIFLTLVNVYRFKRLKSLISLKLSYRAVAVHGIMNTECTNMSGDFISVYYIFD